MAGTRPHRTTDLRFIVLLYEGSADPPVPLSERPGRASSSFSMKDTRFLPESRWTPKPPCQSRASAHSPDRRPPNPLHRILTLSLPSGADPSNNNRPQRIPPRPTSDEPLARSHGSAYASLLGLPSNYIVPPHYMERLSRDPPFPEHKTLAGAATQWRAA